MHFFFSQNCAAKTIICIVHYFELLTADCNEQCNLIILHAVLNISKRKEKEKKSRIKSIAKIFKWHRSIVYFGNLRSFNLLLFYYFTHLQRSKHRLLLWSRPTEKISYLYNWFILILFTYTNNSLNAYTSRKNEKTIL